MAELHSSNKTCGMPVRYKKPPEHVERKLSLISFSSCTATMADRPEYYYKDICLLPNLSYDQVPRGSAKVSPVEGLFVDTLSPEQ